MFDFKRWQRAAPLSLKLSLGKEVKAVAKDCPDVKQLATEDEIAKAEKTSASFLKAAKIVKQKVAKLKLNDHGAKDVILEWIKTIEDYLEALGARTKSLAADEKAGSAEAKQAMVDLKAAMGEVHKTFLKGGKLLAKAESMIKAAAKKDGQEQASAEKAALNDLLAGLPIVIKAMKKNGDEAVKLWRNSGIEFASEDNKMVKIWLGNNGHYSQMITVPANFLTSIKGGAPNFAAAQKGFARKYIY